MASQLWKPYVPSSQMPWDLSRAKHLHRRAAFGATWSELQRDVVDGHETSIARMLDGESRMVGQRNDFAEIANILGESAVGSNNSDRLKAWWFFRMLFSPDPLTEKLTLLWHNHFATSNSKVRRLDLMFKQNQLFRTHARARFGELLGEVLKDPAMLLWLDANFNRKGKPNENLARELMELFTLGVGNYTEDDIRGAARALTGWSCKHGAATFREDRHDQDAKTILGETANFDSQQLAKHLLANPATSHRIAARLCEVFMGENLNGKNGTAAVNELAEGLRKNDLSIAWGVETILRSELFFNDANIGSRISSPVEFMLTSVRGLEALEKPPSTMQLAIWCRRLGQDLFYPPNVGGWGGNRKWLTTRTVVGRSNFAAALVDGNLSTPAVPPPLKSVADKCRVTSKSEREGLAELLLSVPVDVSAIESDATQSEFVARLLSQPEAQLT